VAALALGKAGDVRVSLLCPHAVLQSPAADRTAGASWHGLAAEYLRPTSELRMSLLRSNRGGAFAHKVDSTPYRGGNDLRRRVGRTEVPFRRSRDWTTASRGDAFR